MVCIYCSGETDVINSRSQKRSNQVWRRRKCQACGAIFTTHESIDLSTALMVEVSGRHTPFERHLILMDLLLALQDREDRYSAADEATGTVITRVLALPSKPVFKPSEISAICADVLKKLDKRAWLRYLADHPSLQS